MPASLLHAFGIIGFFLSWLSYDHYRPWVNFHAETLALMGLWLLVASRTMGGQSGAALTAPKWIWITTIAILLPWLQFFGGIALFAGDALVNSIYLTALTAAISLGYTYASTEPRREQNLFPIFCAIWLAALISAVIGLLQWLDLQGPLAMYVVQTDFGERALGNLGQPNQLATLLLMGLAALIWTYEQKRIGPWGLVCGGGFLTLVLVLTQSRAGILSAAAMAFLLTWKTYGHPLRLKPRHVLTWLLLLLTAAQLLPFVSQAMLMDESRNLIGLRDNGRLVIWHQVFNGILEAPWTGHGWNQTPTAHSAGSLTVQGSMTYTNAHNVVLDILAWNGIPLGLALTSLCAYWLLSRIRLVKEISGVYAMACLIPIVIHSLLEYPFAYSYFLVSAGLMVGFVEASCLHAPTTSISRAPLAAILALFLSVAVIAIHEYMKVEEDFRVVRFENLRIGKTPEDYSPPEIWMLSQMKSMLIAARQEAKRGMTPDEMENLRKSSLRFPYGAISLRYAIALGLNGDPQAATKQMKIIRGMYGQGYYDAAVFVLRDLEENKYPELAAVKTR